MPPAFKTVAVVGKSDAVNLPEIIDELAGVLRKRGVAVVMDPATAEASGSKPDRVAELNELASRCDLAIVVGGDGTLISCARLRAEHGVPLVGVNLGTLGFLTDIPADSLQPAIESILDGEFLSEAARVSRAPCDAAARPSSPRSP
jgi:NAD+ kinase